MRRWAPFISLLLAAATASAQDRPSRVLLDEVVAVVDLRETRVLLLSDVEIEARLARARQQGGRGLLQPVDNASLSSALNRLINQLVIVDEAARLQMFEPTKQEIDASVAALRSAIGEEPFDAFVTEYELEETVRDIMRREARVTRYLEGRFRLASRPRESDVLAYIASHKEYRNRDPSAALVDAREKLAKERFEQLASAFITDIRRRARIRILREPSAPLGPTPLSGIADLGNVVGAPARR